MNFFVFFLSIIELALFVFTLCYISVAYAGKKSCFYVKLILLVSLFLIENVVVYVYSYIMSVYGYSSEVIYVLYLIVNCVYIALIRMITKDIVSDPIENYEIAVYIFCVTLQVVLLSVKKYAWFLNITSISFLYVSLRAIILQSKKGKNRSEIILFLSSFFLGVLVIIEDNFFTGYFVALYGDIKNTYTMSISLNIISVVHCAFAIKYCRKEIAMNKEHIVSSYEVMRNNAGHLIENYNLTTREQDVLWLILQGKSNKDIANELFISIGTVKAHTHNIFSKCEVSSKEELLHMLENFNED